MYEVSNIGRVKNVRRNTILRLSDIYGYTQAYLYKDGVKKGIKTHRLVAQAFIENPQNLPQINHKNEIRDDNRVENVEWCTAEYNVNYGNRTKKQRETNEKNGYWSGKTVDTQAYNKKYKAEHRDHIKELNRIWYQKNKEKLRDKRREYLRQWRQKKKNIKNIF